MGRETLGDFEQLVLLAALRLGECAYSVSIIEEIATHTGREPTHGAVYVALRRLEKRGLVTTRVGEASPDRGGRPPRYVTVEPEAVRQLREARESLLSMWNDLEAVTR